jgi:uracil phosphoribosyltransferase
LCLHSAREFIKVMEATHSLKDDSFAILHILRGAPGYKMVEALRENVPVISIRTQYRKGGYRVHFNDVRDIDIIFRDYSGIDSDTNEISALLIPDTYATGRSAEVAINDLLERNLKPRKIILYGFISIPALTRLGELTSEKDIELVSFAIGNIMQLAHNKYDMPLYGLDESLYSETGELKRLGSIVDVETLRIYLPDYVASLDQPGDWSERQSTLFNGYEYERGDIHGHLTRNMEIIDSLRKISSKQSWYNDFHRAISSTELSKLEETLQGYANK